jgi:hypothetical protein
MYDCMECDYDIEDEDCEECPGCGLDAPVSYRWFNNSFKEKIEAAKKLHDFETVADLCLEAYYEAGMFPDPYVMGDMARELEILYRQLNFHDRLIWLYIYDATQYEHCALENPARKAYLHTLEIKRPDLEFHVMDTFDYYNSRRTQSSTSSTPSDLVERKKELLSMYKKGEIQDVEFPILSPKMWDEYELGTP